MAGGDSPQTAVQTVMLIFTAATFVSGALLYGLGEGSSLHVPTPRGPLDLRIVGTLVDYTWSRGTVFIDRPFYREHFQDGFAGLAHETDDCARAFCCGATVIRRADFSNVVVLDAEHESGE